jgi:TRAP-type C4-dicarboxylate transport system substrate-binding protein
MRKKLTISLLLLPLVLSVFLTSHASAAPMTLRVASPYHKDSLLAATTKIFLEEMQKQSGGQVTFTEFWGGTLVKPLEVLDAVGKGVVDLCTGLWIYAPGKVPLGTFEYNFIFNDPNRRTQAKIKRQMYEQLPALKQELEKYNIGPPLIFGPLSAYDIISRVPVKTLDDLKGKRGGATPTQYAPIMKAIGMAPVLSPAPDFYERLERGVIDMAFCGKEVLHMVKLHEIAKYFLSTELNTPTTMSLWINLDTWKKFTPEQRDLFLKVGKRSEEVYLDWFDQHLKKVDEDFKNKGLIINTLSEKDKKQWATVMPDLPAEWAKEMEAKGLPGWKITDTYMELSEKEGWKFPRKWGKR